MTDIGTGSYTILAQTAAEMLAYRWSRLRFSSAIPVSRFLRFWWTMGREYLHLRRLRRLCKLREMIASAVGFDPGQSQFATARLPTVPEAPRYMRPPQAEADSGREH